jgi:hypothetical protein
MKTNCHMKAKMGRYTRIALTVSAMLAALMLLPMLRALEERKVFADVPASDVTLEASVFDGIPVLATITGYEMDSGCPWSAANCETPLYKPYNRNDARWWDNLVEELLASRVHVVLAHGRGCFDPVNGVDGNGNMCPRLLSNMVSAINRADASNVIRLSMWDDTGAYRGAYNVFKGFTDNRPFDLNDRVSWEEVIWKRNIKVWHDTVPNALWFRLEGSPVIAFWSLSDAFFSNQFGNASQLLSFIRTRFFETYGEIPVFIVDRSWIQEDPTIQSWQVYGVNNWFDPQNNTRTYSLWNGQQFGAAVPGFRDPNNPPGCGFACREQSRLNGGALTAGLQEGYDRRARFTYLEGWTDIAESAGYYRSNAWLFPNQYINIVREFADRRTKTLRLQAEACDAYSDTSTGNLGGSYRDGDLDIADLPGSGWVVGWTDPNEWVQFTDVLLSEGNYRFSARVSSGSTNKTIRLEIDNIPVGSVGAPFGGDWSNYSTVALGTRFLPQGKHSLRVVFEQGHVNLDWVFVKKIDNAVSLRTSDQIHFVGAEKGGGSATYVDGFAAGPWETFTLVDINGNSLESGDRVRLQTHNGYFLVAELGGGNTVNANRLAPGPWEEFTIIKVNGGGSIQNGDQIALRTVNNYYVVAEGGGGGILNANRTAIGAWETFTVNISSQ